MLCEVFQRDCVSVARFVFHACSFNHSDISPDLFGINNVRAVGERLSHTPTAVCASSVNPFAFGSLHGTPVE
jgi:hypothetical protein